MTNTSNVAEAAASAGSTGLVVTRGGETIHDLCWAPDEVSAFWQPEVLASGRTREDVASVQKVVVSTLIGHAVAESMVDLDTPVTTYLGEGWSQAEPADEALITIRHQLTMTSGLHQDGTYDASAGTTWRYQAGAPFHLLKDVVVAATGTDLETLSARWIFEPAGMADTLWRRRPAIGEPSRATLDRSGQPFHALITTAFDLARFASASLDPLDPLGIDGWNTDHAWRSATPFNPAYGMLWWLNSGAQLRLPTENELREGPLAPTAPADLVAGLGAMGRIVGVVPSLDLVFARTGGPAGEAGAVPTGVLHLICGALHEDGLFD